jgi:cell division transport system permease protein
MAMRADYVLRETTGNLRRNIGITIATVVTVAVSLAMVGFGLMVGFGVANATERWEGGIEFVVFMQPEATPEQIDAVGADLEANPAVASFEFFDKDRAFEEFRELFADSPEFYENIDKDVLPTSYRVVPVDKDADSVKDLGEQYNAKAGVREVVFAGETIKAVQSLARKIIRTIVALAVVLTVAAAVLIVTTIQMAAFARRREIEVMKLVGATNWFIRVPFMLEGLFQGLVGAVLACVGVWRFAPFFEDLFRDEELPLVQGWMIADSELSFIYLVVLGSGTLIGAIAAGVAVTWFMDV